MCFSNILCLHLCLFFPDEALPCNVNFFSVSVIVLHQSSRQRTRCDGVFSVIAIRYAVALLLEELRINHEPLKRAVHLTRACENTLESVCCWPCPGSPAYKKASMPDLQQQIGIPLSVEWPAEVIGICYIYQLCNLICSILDRSAHTIPSHWGQRLPSSAPLLLSVCYLCGCSEQQRWASHKQTLPPILFF